MTKPCRNLLLLSAIVVQSVLVFNCGGGSVTPSVPPEESSPLSISPQLAAAATGQIVQFSASGGNASPITWSVSGTNSSTTGTIDPTGVYTAPSTAGVFTINASSGGRSATATVTVLAPGTVSPTNHPLVANYSIVPPRGANVTIEFGPDTSYALRTSSQTAPTGGGPVNILVAGMRASTAYHMRAVVDFPDGTQYLDSDQVFTTGSLPAGRVPDMAVSRPSGLPSNGGVELLSLTPGGGTTNSLMALVTDLDGNVIWYYDFLPNGVPIVNGVAQNGDIPFPVKPLPNGHFLVNINTVVGPGPLQVTQEIDLAGNVIRQFTSGDLANWLSQAGYSFPYTASVHHDIAVLPNGHWILIIAFAASVTVEGSSSPQTITADGLVDLNPNWKPVWVWSTLDHLDVNRHPLGLPDWTHSNAVIYSRTDGNLIFSMRNQNWVIKIDYAAGRGTGNILWRLGPGGDLTLQGGVDPVDWNYAQHFPLVFTPQSAGTFQLGLFDNGNNRVLDSSGTVCEAAGPYPTGANPCYSSVPVFQIDETAKTATLVSNDKLPAFSFFGGSVSTFPNGNIEYALSSYGPLPSFGSAPPIAAQVQEATPGANPQVVWQLDITGQYAYRAYRIPSLYPNVQW